MKIRSSASWAKFGASSKLFYSTAESIILLFYNPLLHILIGGIYSDPAFATLKNFCIYASIEAQLLRNIKATASVLNNTLTSSNVNI